MYKVIILLVLIFALCFCINFSTTLPILFHLFPSTVLVKVLTIFISCIILGANKQVDKDSNREFLYVYV